MRQVTLTAMFVAGVLGLSAGDTTAQMGGKNSVTCEGWLDPPGVATIKYTYYGSWSVDPSQYKRDHVEVDRVVYQNNQWVGVPKTLQSLPCVVSGTAKLQEYGTYGTAPPGPGTVTASLPYQQGAVFNFRAKLFATPLTPPNAPPVEVASAIQTITLP